MQSTSSGKPFGTVSSKDGLCTKRDGWNVEHRRVVMVLKLARCSGGVLVSVLTCTIRASRYVSFFDKLLDLIYILIRLCVIR